MDSPYQNSNTSHPTPQATAYWLLSLFTESEALDILRLAAQYDGGWNAWLNEAGLWVANPMEAAKRQRQQQRKALTIFDIERFDNE